MAQLDTGGEDKKKGGKVRSKKQGGSVDLTAMVDLAFLLITFFMLTTSLSKPQSMSLAMPDKNKEKKDDVIEVADNRTLTILLGKDNQLEWYMGRLAEPISGPTKDKYGKDGVRKELLERVKSVPQATGNSEKGLIVIIKPSDKSSYRNLVDVLDEMAITKVPSYAIVDITPDEIKLLESEGLY